MLVKVKRCRKGNSSEAHITTNHLNAHVFTGHMLPSVILSKIILYLLYNFLKTLIRTYSIPDSDLKKKKTRYIGAFASKDLPSERQEL